MEGVGPGPADEGGGRTRGEEKGEKKGKREGINITTCPFVQLFMCACTGSNMNNAENKGVFAQ